MTLHLANSTSSEGFGDPRKSRLQKILESCSLPRSKSTFPPQYIHTAPYSSSRLCCPLSLNCPYSARSRSTPSLSSTGWEKRGSREYQKFIYPSYFLPFPSLPKTQTHPHASPHSKRPPHTRSIRYNFIVLHRKTTTRSNKSPPGDNPKPQGHLRPVASGLSPSDLPSYIIT